jgi:hypothetical protein
LIEITEDKGGVEVPVSGAAAKDDIEGSIVTLDLNELSGDKNENSHQKIRINTNALRDL